MNTGTQTSGGNFGKYAQLSKSAAELVQPLTQGQWQPSHVLNPLQQAAIRRHRVFLKALERKEQVMKGWDIRPLSEEEYRDMRIQTNKHIDTIKHWETVLTGSIPHDDKLIAEDKLMDARFEFRLHYWRAFNIDGLPDEILSNIFRLVTWSTIGMRAGVVARLWVTWTCRRWREVALADPTIWNVIWIRDPYPFHQAMAWIDRSGSAPLDIRLDDRDKQPLTGAQVGEFMDHILLKASTIRSLIVSVNTWEPALAVLKKLREIGEAGAVFNMERFELHRNGLPYIQIADTFQPENLRDPIPLFGGLQNNVPLHFCIVGISIDWQRSALRNLTCLDCRKLPLDRCPTLSRFREILAASPQLYKICLDGASPQLGIDDVNRTPEPILLPHLRTLILADMQPRYASYLVRLLSAPRLRDLTLMSLAGQDFAGLFNAIAGRFPALRILTLFTVVVQNTNDIIEALFNLFCSVPLLKYLRMANSSPLFLEVLCWDGESKGRHFPKTRSAVICQNLDLLEFHFIGPPERVQDWFEVVRGWQKYRSQIGVPLQKLWVPDTHFEKFTMNQRGYLTAIAPVFVFHHQTTSLDEMLIISEN